MIYVTGDIHGNWRGRFMNADQIIYEYKELTREDFVIVCGDFGIWQDTQSERYWLDWLQKKPFTLLFVDGNHENFDRLEGGEFETMAFHGGKAHRVRENVYHLIRGEIFELCGNKFFAFGGASSHDISDGILELKDFNNDMDLVYDKIDELYRQGKTSVRINHISWWERELPNETEMKNGWKNLENNNYEVDYIITHSPYTSILKVMDAGYGLYQADILIDYLQKVKEKVKYKQWFFGHMHVNQSYNFDNSMCLFGDIVRIV